MVNSPKDCKVLLKDAQFLFQLIDKCLYPGFQLPDILHAVIGFNAQTGDILFIHQLLDSQTMDFTHHKN